MAACVIPTMERIPEETVNVTLEDAPKRKRALKVNMPRTTLTDEERTLGIYEDVADCADLSDSDDDNYYDDEDDGYADDTHGMHFSNHGYLDKSKFQKLDLNSLIVPQLNLKLGPDDVRLRDTDSLDVNISGLRGKATTPTNTEYSEISELREIESAGKNSRVGLESREAVYKKAIDLMTVRCTSVQANNGEDGNEPLLCVKNQPFGATFPKYFYVQQNRPLPMPPLKAWRGYNGNVYFEPMQVNQVKGAALERQTPDVEKCSEKLKKILEPRLKNPETSSQAQPTTRPSTRGEKSNKSRHESDSTAESVTMSVSISDKKAILSRLNQRYRDDEYWPEPKESVGSLKVDANNAGKNKVKINKSKPTYQKDKICKGSVAHKVAIQRRSKPFFAVNGGKFVAPSAMSPLLRTQTQYSQSNQRMTVNSPDLFNSGVYEKLPPLEQLRASLRHIDNTGSKQMVVVPPNVSRGQQQKGRPAYVKFSHNKVINS